ncbi:MAG: zinc-finger domain-containing protein [Gammaproteobacteria bacterium]|nr:zinc-finger domain-containing protein [Gammaproteobacteria bacterium]
MANHQSTQACTERQHIITEQDLPLSCPSRGMQLWDAHPRVYLPIEKKGKIACPYCGTLYVLKKDNPDHPSIETWYQEGGGK